MADVIDAYLASLKSAVARGEAAQNSYTMYAAALWDFATGLPPRFNGSPLPPSKSDYIHHGYGARLVADLIPLDVESWLASHPKWAGTRYTATRAVKRCFNWAVKAGLIPTNPLAKVPTPRQGVRDGYLENDQEAAVAAHSTAEFRIAMSVLLRTGARPGKEFAAVTAAHVEDTAEGMRWVFGVKESKTGHQTGKERIIYVAPELVPIVQEQMERYPVGPIFRNARGSNWTAHGLDQAFSRACQRAGLVVPGGCYVFRHTFAKRMLGGYWTGQPVTIETLAGLMGNSPAICWRHYAKWCKSYQAPLFAAVGYCSK